MTHSYGPKKDIAPTFMDFMTGLGIALFILMLAVAFAGGTIYGLIYVVVRAARAAWAC